MDDFKRYLVHLHRKDLWKLTFIVEGYEGAASFTTLPFRKTDWQRTVELFVPKGWEECVNGLLKDLKSEIFPMEVTVVEHSSESVFLN
ncbi:hypothetical protein ACFLRA_02710 [Bdellovibrionota bacterium]